VYYYSVHNERRFVRDSCDVARSQTVPPRSEACD
jgi:hypothetical protein